MCIKFAPQHVPTFSPSANLYPRRPSVGLWLWWEAALSQMDQGRWCCVRCWICWITILHANREVPWWQKCVKLRYEMAACPSMAGFHSYSYFSFSIYLSALLCIEKLPFSGLSDIFWSNIKSISMWGDHLTLQVRPAATCAWATAWAWWRSAISRWPALTPGELDNARRSWMMCSRMKMQTWREKRELSFHIKAWGKPHS